MLDSRDKSPAFAQQSQKDQETREIAGYFKTLSTIASALDTLQDIPDPSPEAQTSEQEGQKQVTTGPDAGSGIQAVEAVKPATFKEGDLEVAEALRSMADPTYRIERVRRIITELELLGPPAGDPAKTGITRQEELVLEATGLIGLWKMTEADEAYLSAMADREAAVGEIGGKVATGDLRGAMIDILLEALTPTTLGDGTTASISVGKSLTREIQPHFDGVVNWRIPQPRGGQEETTRMILSNPAYPVMKAAR